MKNELRTVYQFNAEDAVRYGTDAAIFLNELAKHIYYHVKTKKHEHEGMHWAYNSRQTMTEMWPWWTARQLDRIISKLESEKVIKSGNYNATAYDRTLWYTIIDLKVCARHDLPIPSNGDALPNGEIEKTKPSNGLAQTGQPIPLVSPYKKEKEEELSQRNTPSTDGQEEKKPIKIRPGWKQCPAGHWYNGRYCIDCACIAKQAELDAERAKKAQKAADEITF